MKKLSFWPLAWTLAVFAAAVFTLDVLAGLLFPNWYVMQKAWEFLLPGYTFISWGAFLIGLVESFIGGFLTAVLFVPIYNYFHSRSEPETVQTMTPASQHH
ncbi:MAG TPA: hypothetical protein VF982_07575 [Anaerolineales bacterium]